MRSRATVSGASSTPRRRDSKVRRKGSKVSCADRRGRSLLSDDQWHSLAHSLRLSGREFQIVQCLFDDEKELAIAKQLGISAHTVHTYLERLYRKVGVASRSELIVRVFAEHLSVSVDSAGGHGGSAIPRASQDHR